MAAFLTKGGTSSNTIKRLQHKTAAKQVMVGIEKRAAAAGRVAAKAASRAYLREDERQNGAGRQANAAVAANAAERAARHMPDRRVVVEEDSDSGGGAPKKKKKRKSGIGQLTWPVRAVAIFMFLHPQLFNSNAKVTSTMFGVSRSTFLGWLTPSYICKWHDMVSDMTWAQGRAEIKGFVSKFGSKYAGVPDDAKIPASVLNPYAQARGAHAPKVLSKFNTALSGASKGGLARRQPDKFVSLKQDSEHFISTGGAAGQGGGGLARGARQASLAERRPHQHG